MIRILIEVISVRLLCSVLALAALVGGLPALAQTDPKPNVVLFMVDDWGWTDWQYDAQLNPTGSGLYETPNMLRLAQMGVNFTNGYSANGVCSPSRAAVMTGKDPARLRITDWITGGGWTHPTLADPADWDMSLDAEEVTLAEALKANGYDTAFFGKWHLGSNNSFGANPLNHGFDLNIGGNHTGSPPGGWIAGSDGAWNAPNLSGYAADAYLTDVISDEAVGYLQDRQTANDADPFFMFVSHYAVHTPVRDAPAATVQYFQNKLAANGGPFNEHDSAMYAAMVKHVDDGLGALMDQLEAQDQLDNTVILLVADNGGLWAAQGDPTSNTPLREGKGSWYEGGLRTPFVVSWAGNADVQQGVLSERVVIGHDIYSTVLELTGTAGDAGHNAKTDGMSFAKALRGEDHQRGATFWHYPHISDQDAVSNLVTNGTYISAARLGDWKLIYFYADQHWELYNLADDLGETTDLAGDNPGVVTQLGRALAEHLTAIGAQMPIDRATNQPVPLPATDGLGLGDVNFDGVVDQQDLDTMLLAFGRGTDPLAWTTGELTGDGRVDHHDLRQILTHWTDASSPPVYDVPEPGSLGLLGSAGSLLALLMRR